MKTVICLFISIMLPFCTALFDTGISYGQPTSEKIREMESLIGSGSSGELLSVKQEIEEDYLSVARHNIEQYRKSGAVLVFTGANGQPLENIEVKIDQVSQDFLFGALLFEIAGHASARPYKEDEFKDRFKALFNLGILPFYWASYERTAGNPLWQRNQSALEWALENGITLKGHPLGWTSPAGTPQWLLGLPPETATDLYKARIQNNVIGYKGKIDIWDVVNEPVNTVPWDVALADTDNDNSLRYNVTGYTTDDFAGWVEQSYRWAYDANPDGDYILNEYFTLAIPEIRDRFYDLISELVRRNTPISGIGIQGHEPREMWFSPVEMYKTFDLYKQFGLPLHITEFIPQSSGKDITGWREGVWTEETQAEFAEQFYTLAFGHPSIASITWWAFTDRNVWLEGGGLLDAEYNPKPVYDRLKKLIKDEWMTRNIHLVTDPGGSISFRGFFGRYDVSVTKPDGSTVKFDVHLQEGETNYWQFTL
ncbi:MAG: glycoside hydrolase family 10 [Marinilabiliales bacterium]|nr:MAG: glycoside hydrolase family 10 [Marinilabiliales bacterium]